MGVSLVQLSNVKDVLVAWRRRLKKSWKFGPLDIWQFTLKERIRQIFEGKASSHMDFKLYFLRMWYSWSQVLDDGSKVSFLDFVDKIMHGSLKA